MVNATQLHESVENLANLQIQCITPGHKKRRLRKKYGRAGKKPEASLLPRNYPLQKGLARLLFCIPPHF